jgi:hypothetical protein
MRLLKIFLFTDGDSMVSYLEKLEQREGSIYENDVISKIISSIVEAEPLESILILDDLDRLDPEHVFRILNVFAAHFKDELKSEWANKFHFKKVIIVCDINNLRSIFHHKYGDNADFNGYIDKFYTSDIYHFDNKRAVSRIINKVIDSIRLKDGGDGDSIRYVTSIFFSKFLQDLFEILVDTGNLSIRNVMRIYDKLIGYYNEPINFKSVDLPLDTRGIVMAFQLRIVRDVFGDYKNMILRIKESSKKVKEFPNQGQYFDELFHIVIFDQR